MTSAKTVDDVISSHTDVSEYISIKKRQKSRRDDDEDDDSDDIMMSHDDVIIVTYVCTPRLGTSWARRAPAG